MIKIDLQSKTEAQKGKIEIYWFENEFIDLKKTLFHRMYIPLKPFYSGLARDPQPLETEIVIDWLDLKLENPTELDNFTLSSSTQNNTEVSIYLGNAHNPCDIKRLILTKIGLNTYKIECQLFVDFFYENVALNEDFYFTTELLLDPIITEN